MTLTPADRARYPSLCERRGLIYYRWRRAGRDRYQRLPALDHPDFGAQYAAAVAAKRPKLKSVDPQLIAKKVRKWNARQSDKGDGDRVIPAWLLALAREARKRAARKSIEFTLTRADLSLLSRRCSDQCEVTGLPFRHEPHEGSLYRPFAPSLDRIDPRQGYTFRNSRVVCVIVNAALNQWGEEAFWTMVSAAHSSHQGATELGSRGQLSKSP